MSEEFVIIGAGVAGIAAANRFADLGKHAIVVEAGEYPSPKVCGEFLSPECFPILNNWGIHPTFSVVDAEFQTPTDSLQFKLPVAAASMSHMERDAQLLAYAKQKGITVLTKTQVVDLQKNNQITLSTGEQIEAKNILFATGRMPQFQTVPPKMHYVGIKNHIKGVKLENKLEMYLFDGAYVGLVPVAEETINMVCLARGDSGQIEDLAKKNPQLERYLIEGQCVYSEWLKVRIPGFGVKETPKWQNAYFMGDAAGSIPPVTGDGVAMGLLSGILAADYAVKGDPEGYRKAWLRKFSRPIKYGLFLHYAVLNPTYSNVLLKSCSYFNKLRDYLYYYTRNVLD